MAENRCNEMSSSSPTSSSPHDECANNDSKANYCNKNSLNAPKYGTPVPNRVFVGGIPSDATEADIRQLFAQFGNVVSVRIINDRAGVPRGYGFITFDSEEEAKKVIKESDNLVIKNRKLNVSIAIKKQQQNGPLEYGQRVMSNGALMYTPITVNSVSNLLPEMGLYSTAEGIPFYKLCPQYMTNTMSAATYPYAYQGSNVFLTAAQPSVQSLQSLPQFQTNTPQQSYQYGFNPVRIPLTSQNIMGANIANMNTFLQIPASLPQHNIAIPSSSMPMYSIAANTPNADCGRNLNAALNSMNLIQAPVYAIQNVSNMPQTNSNAMACVQNVQLKATDSPDMCVDNVLSATPDMVWQPQQRVPNNCSNKSAAVNRNHNITSKSHNNANSAPTATSYYNSKRNNSMSNSSVNSSQTQKRIGHTYGIRNTKGSTTNRSEGDCPPDVHSSSNANQSNASNHSNYTAKQFANKAQPQPQTVSSQAVQSQMSNKQSIALVPKFVNGIQIYALANVSAGECDSYCALTPPLNAAHPSVLNNVHKM